MSTCDGDIGVFMVGKGKARAWDSSDLGYYLRGGIPGLGISCSVGELKVLRWLMSACDSSY